MSRSYNIGLHIQGSSTYGRDIIRGVILFANTEPAFQARLCPSPNSLVRNSDAVIIQSSRKSDNLLKRHDLIGINVSNVEADSFLPRLINDDHLAGRMAADHLIECGFSHFLYLTEPGIAYGRERGEGFLSRIRDRLRGTPYSCTTAPRKGFLKTPPSRLEKFLSRQPVACFCANDSIAVELAHYFKKAGMHIPNQFAVLGVDNDELQNLRSPVPLSSIQLNGERIGYAAAEAIFAQLTQQHRPEAMQRIPPVGIVVRASTNVLSHPDPVIRQVLSHISTHYADAIQVQDLVNLTGLSRRSLEMRFRKVCGDTLLQRIHAIRIDRAKKLLVFTPHTVETIAQKTGFGDSHQMIATFKHYLGVTPGAYRRQFKHGLPG